MKIVSRFKDYYDFVAGYDTDPRKVFVRGGEIAGLYGKPAEFPDLVGEFVKDAFYIGEIWFCDQHFPYLKDIEANKFYYQFECIPEEVLQRYYRLFEESRNINTYRGKYRGIKLHFGITEKQKYSWQILHDKQFVDERYKAAINTKFNQPIFFTRERDGYMNEIVRNGSLMELNFSQVKPPQEAFTELYNWIPYVEPELPSDVHDMQRFEGKGFDKKTSFRNVK